MTEFAPDKWSRRDALSLAIAAGASALCASPVLAAGQPALITKAIPASGERLPVIGIGTNSFSESKSADLAAVLKRMVELGGTVVDTAASYGESEQVLGELLESLGIRSKIFLATKLTGAGFGVSGMESFERSLQRLKTDHLDLLQVHNLNGVEELWPQLQEWKASKKIRYIGTTTSNSADHPKMIALMRKYALDFVQVDYSIANRDAAATVFPVALERKIAVIVNVPFGGRGGKNISLSGSRPLPSVAAQVGAVDWPQLLLKYVVSHPAVTCTIPGSTKVEHLEDNESAGHGALPDAAQRLQIEHDWDTSAGA